MSLKIFLSYAKEDQQEALKYFDLLKKEGTSPWMDIKCLLPGQNWEAEIERAFSDANIVILLLSNSSVKKRGFVQREANDAIERLRYKQPTDIYVIPLLLEKCEVPAHIGTRLQYVDLSLSDAWEQVCASLKLAAEQQSIELDKGINVGLFQVFNSKVEDEWQGLPGHDISIEFPRFESLEHPNLASELTYFFQGRALSVLINSRQKPWNQYPELFEDKADFSSTNGRWDNFGIVHSNNSILSLTYEVGWYGAGAAHPNHHFETFNFWFKDRLFFLELEDFFIDITSALIKISDLCISALAKEYWIRTNEKPDNDQMEWFNKGAAPDLINFEAFNVGADHFTFLFAPYQVAAYAFGRWSVDISFYDLLDFLKPDGLHKLAMKSIEDN